MMENNEWVKSLNQKGLEVKMHDITAEMENIRLSLDNYRAKQVWYANQIQEKKELYKGKNEVLRLLASAYCEMGEGE